MTGKLEDTGRNKYDKVHLQELAYVEEEEKSRDPVKPNKMKIGQFEQ